MLIEVKNITKTIKKTDVLKDINLSLKDGTVYGFKGVNGSGKTMLMRAICGLISVNEGSVEINGEQLGKDISFPRSIGALIENPAFISNYSGFQNLKVLANIQKKISDDKINETLDFVGLGDAGNKKYRKYSLGMKQRLGIAAAIMEEPELLILDEPLNGLDTSGVDMVHRVLEHFKAKDTLIILACHDYMELVSLCDEIITIENGKIISSEPADKSVLPKEGGQA